MRRLPVVWATVLVLSAHHSVEANLLVNGGFETVVPVPGGLPTGYGYWAGNSSEIVGSSSGIVPFEGSKMFHFIYTDDVGPSSSTSCNVRQIIDVRAYQGMIETGQAIAFASAGFNRVGGDSETDTQFSLALQAFPGDPSNYPNDTGIQDYVHLFSDSDPNTWESLTAQLPLPTDTGYLVVGIWPTENVHNDVNGVEFDGHYADAVSLTIVPEPSTILLLSMAALVAIRRRTEQSA